MPVQKPSTIRISSWSGKLPQTPLCLSGLCVFLAGLWVAVLPVKAASRTIDFSREILPILSDACFQCHGPDPKSRKAGLRLDKEESAKAPSENGSPILSPGASGQSELYHRLVTEDTDDLMPPAELNRPLSAEQIQLMKEWIDQGATWGKHWALNPIKRPTPPDSAVHPIDAFVDKELDRAGLTAQPIADRRTLIRRLALDLTGLPPTPAELASILDDQSETWWENAIDQYMASPSYGERMAWPWLDAARYADSNGYQGDRERTMWPWRDWVVRAFNENLPWDTFTIWQLAGDLLPGATPEQQLATGFCRNHMINGEGGRIPEENRVDYVMDMTETMGTVWLGATLNCSRCHDHKYDAYTREEYYQLFDFFNQTPVTGAGGDPQTPPFLAVPTEAQRHAIETATRKQKSAQDHFDATMRQHRDRQGDWEVATLQKIRQQLKDGEASEEDEIKRLESLQAALNQKSAERSKEASDTIRKALIASIPALQAAHKELEAASASLNQLRRSVPKVMVMQERKERRTTPMLERGLYNQQRGNVSAAVPAFLPALPQADEPPNRLDLARWLVRRDHPLTARVTVNRFWQQLFGMGLVKTPEDFGVQGEFPRHLELLDWLAAEFMASGWDVKHLLKVILTSDTYQRRSVTTDTLLEADPENRLYARGARYRLPSWMIRDQALAAAGLLDTTLGGPPVNGYQPAGVWEDATFGNKKYSMDTGRKLYRRSLYTFWRRIVAPTLFFDTASRQTCTVDTKRTNSPLHALTTLNDTTFVEAARALAARAMQDAGDADTVLHHIYARVLPRPPSAQETEIWTRGFERAKQYFEANPADTQRWLEHGASPNPGDLDTTELAAWSTVCLGVLNLDETLNRE